MTFHKKFRRIAEDYKGDLKRGKIEDKHQTRPSKQAKTLLC